MKNRADSAISPKSYKTTIKDGNTVNGKMHFFAAANSDKGFVSMFDGVFGKDKIDRLYILGGGPGSGKSTMMKRVAGLSEENGFTTEYIHCSSSPYSLDGVIIKEKSVAVIDGTSPHTYAPSLPGVREIAIDPGRAWDTDMLYERKEKISGLACGKKKAYKKAYIYLRAAGLLKREMSDMTKQCILWDKLKKNVLSTAERFFPAQKNSESFCCDIRLQRAVSGAGNIYFESFSEMAETTFFISDFRSVGFEYLGMLYEQAQKSGNHVIVSYDPENTSLVDGLYFPANKTAFTMYASTCDRRINCERFVDKTFASDMRQKYVFSEKSRNSLLCEAYASLAEAGRLHDMIEAEYRPCTDFSVTEKISEELCQDIFG